jgi:hypothetical protein
VHDANRTRPAIRIDCFDGCTALTPAAGGSLIVSPEGFMCCWIDYLAAHTSRIGALVLNTAAHYPSSMW